MSLIHVSNLSFTYEGSYDPIFENVSFQMDTQWKLGFTGRNGRGKTTFLKLLLGQMPYHGTISASVQFEYFPFPVPDPSENTLEIAKQIAPDLLQWELMRELSLLNVAEDVLYRPFATLSCGEQTKVLLAALFLKENSFLLIDEPTNHLDMEAREIVSRYLKGKEGFILVSHDRFFLDSCIDHILSINKTNIQLQRGNFSSWWQNKEYEDQFELAQNEKLKKEIKSLSAAAKRTSDWSDKVEKTKYATRNSGLRPDTGFIGHKAAKMMQRSKNIEKRRENAVAEKAALLQNIESADCLKLSPLAYHTKRLVTLDNIAIRYGDKQVCEDISFSIEQGDRIALWGKNGCGKSSLLKLLCGEDIPYTGQLQKGSRLRISYLPQDTSFLSGSLSAFAEENSLDMSLFKTILRKLDFSRIQFEKDMSDFSAGQKKKVLLAKSLCEQAHLYIWDEPLNFIDVFSRMQVQQLLQTYRPTLLFVEHDRTFCDEIATKTLAL